MMMKLDSKYFDRIRTRRKRDKEPEPQASVCQWDDCNKPGAHRAPVGRNAEGQFFLFCFAHVKEYNKGYNYFSGLSDGEIARYQKEAVTGHRPTWTMGINKNTTDNPYQSRAYSGATSAQQNREPCGVLLQGGASTAPRYQQTRKLRTLEAKAFEILELPAEADEVKIRAKYKELVKKHHPDANGGDRGSEERFRAVVHAYQLLKQSGFC